MNTSVIIPCYNAECYLAQAIGSVLEQSRSAHEIIIVDDGSTDGSLAIARLFEDGCGGLVRVYPGHFGRASRVRNIGASYATGDALMFLDADDVLAPYVLQSLTNVLSQRPAAIAACPWRRLEWENGKWMSRPASCAPRMPDQDTLSAWLSGWYYPPCSVLWSRDAFVRTGGWDEEATLNDDGDLVMRALIMGIPLVESTSGTSYYRRLPDGQISLSSTRYTYDGLAARISVREKIAWFLEEQGRIDAYRAPLSRSLALIAADARRHPSLYERARAASRNYAPLIWTRVIDVTRRAHLAGTRPTAAPPRNLPEEIRFGVERAERVLSQENPSLPVETVPGPAAGRPTVSVVVYVHNDAGLLPRALDCVLAQVFQDFEVLVVDDGSSDDPEAVVRACDDSRLRYLRQSEEAGVAAARNRGLREARGQFVAFLETNDEWLPERLVNQIEILRRSPPDVGLICVDKEAAPGDCRRTAFEPSTRRDLCRELLLKNLRAEFREVVMRRNLIRTVGFFDETLPVLADTDYWLRTCRRHRIEYISTPRRRYGGTSAALNSSTDANGMSLRILAGRKEWHRFAGKHGSLLRTAGVSHRLLPDSAQHHYARGFRLGRARRLTEELRTVPRRKPRVHEARRGGNEIL